MINKAKIEAAIARLPEPQATQLVQWLETFRQRRSTPLPIENQLEHARGAAIPGANAKDLIALSRGEG
jgi:hypothetical protein